jgi:uncharacterized protein YprB with RNaseH-like and TPR domain
MRELKKLKEEKLIFFDIETAPVVKELDPDSQLYASWDYKVNKTGEMTQDEIIASYSREAGLYPEFAKVVSIVIGKIVKGKIVLVTLDDPDEINILNRFNDLVARNSADTLVGFVNIGFDTPFVFKRMLINSIEPHDKLDSSGLKPWEVEEVDLSKMWQATSFSRGSLINIATAFGLPSPKDDIAGADVGRVYWSEGAKGLSRISKYCRKDVVTTINIFKKMRLEDPLELASPEDDTEPEQSPVLTALFDGADYGKKEKGALLDLLKSMTKEERTKTFVVLDSVTSTAKGKKTKLTKAHVRALKKATDD